MVYIHVPFCRSFCTYCDFYSEILCRKDEGHGTERYLESIIKEIEARREEISEASSPETLYIGGGTPSVLPLSVLRSMVGALGNRHYDEFTVEVNPEDITEKGLPYLQGLRELGVNRVSMGVESLDDTLLRWMNRRHSADGARKAFRMLREAGFDNVSVDLITGIGGMSEESLEAGIGEILGWQPEHISAYQLSIEEGSALAEMADSGQYHEMDEDACRRQYELMCSKLGEAGYEHYEISNWCRPGKESLHNSAYWERRPYVGLGPGAHSLRFEGDRQIRSWNSEVPYGWTAESEVLTEDEIREERIMLGLRTAKGAEGRRIEEKDWFIADSIIAEMI